MLIYGIDAKGIGVFIGVLIVIYLFHLFITHLSIMLVGGDTTVHKTFWMTVLVFGIGIASNLFLGVIGPIVVFGASIVLYSVFFQVSITKSILLLFLPTVLAIVIGVGAIALIAGTAYLYSILRMAGYPI